MKKLIGLGLLTMSVAAFAASAPASIAVVDAIAVTKASAEKAQQDLEKKYTPEKDKLDKEQAKIMTDFQDLQKNQATMSDEEKQKQQQSLGQREQALRQQATEVNKKYVADSEASRKQLENKLNSAVSAVAKKNNYEVVLDSRTAFYTGPQVQDITAQVQKQYTK